MQCHIARWISHGLNPAGVALAVWGGWWYLHPQDRQPALLGLLFYVALPALSIICMVRAGRIDALYPRLRQQRNGLLLVGVVSYMLGGIALYIAAAPVLLLAAGVSFAAATLLVFLVNLRWKISIHCVGVGGAASLLLLAFGLGEAWPCLLAVALVAWARLHLRAHTPLQVVAGLALGCGVSILSFGLLYARWMG